MAITKNHSKEISAHYDTKGAVAKASLNKGGFREIQAYLLAPYDFAHMQIPSTNLKHALDIGCGTGLHAGLIAKKGYKVTGVDLSSESIKTAKRHLELQGLSNACTFKTADIQEYLERSSEKFDVIFGSGIMYYLDLDEVMPLILSHLNPGGQFICVETNGDNFLLNAYRRLRYRKSDIRDEQTLNQLLRLSNFEKLGQYFDESSIEAFDLLTLPGAALKSTPKLGSLYQRVAANIDRVILKAPGFRRLSFKVVFQGKIN